MLERLLENRGTVLTEDEYFSVRKSILQGLESSPKYEVVPVLLGVATMIVGIISIGVAASKWRLNLEQHSTGWGLVGLLCLTSGGYFALSSIWASRADFRRPLKDRLTELEDLLNANLIQPAEYERIKASLNQKFGPLA